MLNVGRRDPRSRLVLFVAALFVTACSNEVTTEHKDSEPLKKIYLYGAIDEGYSYSIRVVYTATNKKRACQSYSFFGGWTSSSEYLTYAAQIARGKHAIEFPVNKLSSTTGCQWQPSYVLLCTSETSQPQKDGCTSLIEFYRSSTTSGAEDMRKYVEQQAGALLAWCREDTVGPWYCSNATGKSLPPELSYADVRFPLLLFSSYAQGQYPMTREDSYEINIHFDPSSD